MKKELLTTIIILVSYSIIAFAYAHSTFTSKDILCMINDRLDRLELKLDRMIEIKNAK